MSRNTKITGTCLLIATLMVPHSMAWGLTTLPQSADPSRIPERGHNLLLPHSLPRPAEKTPEAAPPVDTYSENPLFTLLTVKVEGNTILSDTTIKRITDYWIGRPFNANDAAFMANKLAVAYRDAGYIIASVSPDFTASKDGIMVMRATERALVGVNFEITPDNHRLAKSDILAAVRDRLLASKPLLQQDIEREILLLEELPGIKVSSLIDTTTDDDYILNLKISQKRYTTELVLNNRNSSYFGPWSVTAIQDFNGVFSPVDRVVLYGQSTPDLKKSTTSAADYLLPLNSQGTVLWLYFLKGWNEAGYPLEQFELIGQSIRMSAKVSHPLYRSAYENLFISSRFILENQKGKILGEILSKDKTRSLDAEIAYEYSDSFGGRSRVSINTEQGLPFLGASDNDNPYRSRTSGRSDFTKTVFSANHVHPLGNGWEVMGAVSGQFAFTQLLSGKEFCLGGISSTDFGRAYDSCEINGDHGLASILELRYRPVFADAPEWLANVQVYASYDYGAAWRIDTNNRKARIFADSAAVGLRFDRTEGLNFDFQISKPLNHTVYKLGAEPSKDPRFFLSIRWRF